MRTIFLISSLLLTAASAAVLRVDNPNVPTAEKPAIIVDVKPRVREGAIRKQIRYGPLTLPASKVLQNSYSTYSIY
jgi:hypothetical protein